MLVEDAWFCHKCGKPQRDIRPAEREEVAAPTPAVVIGPLLAPAPTDEIGFRNRLAVRIAVLCAGLAWMLAQLCSLLVLSVLWIVLWMTLAGFIAVYFYHRRTGVFLSPRGGARMGWLTGTFCFLIAVVMAALNFLVVSGQNGLKEMFREQIRSQNPPNMDEALKMLDSPAALGLIAVFVLIFFYVMSIVLPMIGGALGAKVLEKE
jgi:hypothetical protein